MTSIGSSNLPKPPSIPSSPAKQKSLESSTVNNNSSQVNNFQSIGMPTENGRSLDELGGWTHYAWRTPTAEFLKTFLGAVNENGVTTKEAFVENALKTNFFAHYTSPSRSSDPSFVDVEKRFVLGQIFEKIQRTLDGMMPGYLSLTKQLNNGIPGIIPNDVIRLDVTKNGAINPGELTAGPSFQINKDFQPISTENAVSVLRDVEEKVTTQRDGKGLQRNELLAYVQRTDVSAENKAIANVLLTYFSQMATVVTVAKDPNNPNSIASVFQRLTAADIRRIGFQDNNDRLSPSDFQNAPNTPTLLIPNPNARPPVLPGPKSLADIGMNPVSTETLNQRPIGREDMRRVLDQIEQFTLTRGEQASGGQSRGIQLNEILSFLQQTQPNTPERYIGRVLASFFDRFATQINVGPEPSTNRVETYMRINPSRLMGTLFAKDGDRNQITGADVNLVGLGRIDVPWPRTV